MVTPLLAHWNFYSLAQAIELHHVQCDGFVQERRNSSALAMELRLSCTNPSSVCKAVVIISDVKLCICLYCLYKNKCKY